MPGLFQASADATEPASPPPPTDAEAAATDGGDDDDKDKSKDVAPAAENEPKDVAAAVDEVPPAAEKEEVVYVVHVPRTDYVLGLADLTGELMRQAINAVGRRDVAACFELRSFLHEIHSGFLHLPVKSDSKEVSMKVRVLRDSLKKVMKLSLRMRIQYMLYCISKFV